MKLNLTESSQTAALKNSFWPYRLEHETQDPGHLYDLLDDFTQKVVFKGILTFEKELLLFRESSLFKEDLSISSVEGNLLDLLITGILWNEHCHDLSKCHQTRNRLFFNFIQNKSNPDQVHKISSIKGDLSKWVSDDLKDRPIAVSHENLYRLVALLKTNENYIHESNRMDLWCRFFEFYPAVFFDNLFPRILSFANWFVIEAKIRFDNFRKEKMGAILSHDRFSDGNGKPEHQVMNESEFYLNLVGGSILNRLQKTDFDLFRYKSLILPEMMIKKMNCQAMKIGNIRYCGHCSSDCQVSSLTRRMNSLGVETIVLSQDKTYCNTMKRYSSQNKTAVVSAVEIPRLLEEGYELRRNGVAAQLVFPVRNNCANDRGPKLEYTDIDIARLEKIVY